MIKLLSLSGLTLGLLAASQGVRADEVKAPTFTAEPCCSISSIREIKVKLLKINGHEALHWVQITDEKLIRTHRSIFDDALPLESKGHKKLLWCKTLIHHKTKFTSGHLNLIWGHTKWI